MSKRSASEMLLEAGILPKNAVAQLERHRLVPEGTTERVGVRPVSLEQDSTAALRFADELQSKLDEEDAEIRQQDLVVAGKQQPVWIQWGDGTVDSKSKTAIVDKLGRVYLPIAVMGNGQKKKVKGISFSGRKQDIKRVEQTEPRYEGEVLKYLACYLED